MDTAISIPMGIPSVEQLVEGLTSTQRDYLLMRAMGCSSDEARNILHINTDRLHNWKRSSPLFAAKLQTMEHSDGQWARDALTIYLDINLPFVVHELLEICFSGSGRGLYEKPHKDKEKAIEFYLRDLCGVSKAVKKAYNFEHFLLELSNAEVK